MTTTTAIPTTPQVATRGRPLARAAAIAAAAFVVLLIVAGFLDPGYSQVSEAISALGSTESHSSGLMTLGFLALGAAATCAGLALLRSVPSRLARAGAVLVIVAGVLTGVEGFLHQSCSNLQASCLAREHAGQVSGSHVLHNLVALPVFVFLVIASFLLAFSLRRMDRLRHLWLPAMASAVVTVVFFVWFGSSSFGSYGGLVQRGLVLFAYGLPLLVSWAATRPASRR